MTSTRSTVSLVFRLAVLALALFLSTQTIRADELSSKAAKDTFKSGGADIQVLRFEPKVTAKRPVVIMLHGADGWQPMKGFDFAAEGLNANGYIAILIRYYDRTNTPDNINAKQRADFVNWLKGDAAKQKNNTSRQHFEQWMETVQDAVAYARKLPNVDESRIGIAGFSLGGYLALSAAPKCNPPVKAVVEMFGGLPQEYCKNPGKLPPTLIVHGDEDEIVPVNEAYKAAGLILSQKQNVAIEIHKGFGHVLCPRGSDEPSPVELFKARANMMNFFKNHFETESRK